MKRFAPLFIVLCTLTATAAAEPYWYAYEGNDFPENEGWIHATSEPPANRWLEGGRLLVDTRAAPDIIDSYAMVPASGFDLADGESFIMRWGLLVDEATPWESPGAAVTTNDGYAVTFIHTEDYVKSAYEPWLTAGFDPGVPHSFEMRSTEMRSYRLYVDGSLAFEGIFSESFFPTGAGFGDLSSSRSLAQWDYFRFGIVPEPSTLAAAMVVLTIVATTRGRRNRESVHM